MEIKPPKINRGNSQFGDPSNFVYVRKFKAHSGHVNCLLLLRGKSVASAGRDCIIRIYNPLNFRQFANLKKHTKHITSLVEKHQLLISSSMDKTILLWDAEHMFVLLRAISCLQYPLILNASPFTNIFSSGGNNEKAFRLWHYKRRSALVSYPKYETGVQTMVYFLPHLNRILEGSIYGKLRIYQFRNMLFDMRLLHTWDFKRAIISSCVELPGQRILVAS